jgi:uncharacterized damage-inducible protein DinB
MEMNQALIAEIRMEAANTRKILANVPLDKNDYKPHERSMTLGRLATHVAELPGWVSFTMDQDGLDFATMDYKPVIASTTEELLAILDSNVNKAVASLENSKAEDFGKMWTLRNGDHVHFSLPKAAVVRSFALSHLYHHRGQLSVYLRLLDTEVPGMYGPSKDDQIAMQAAMSMAK